MKGGTVGPLHFERMNLSYRQAILLQGVLPVLVAVVVPIGLTAFFLGLKGMSLREAIDHGELFLAGGNAAFAGCVVLIAGRPDEAINAAIAAIFALVLVVLPCYGLWAYVSVGSLAGETFVKSFVEIAGGMWAVAGVAVSLAFVRYTYRPALKAIELP